MHKSSWKEVAFHHFLDKFAFLLKLASFQAQMIDVLDWGSDRTPDPSHFTWVESPRHKSQFWSYFKILQFLEFRQ